MDATSFSGSISRRFWAKVDKSPGRGPWGNCWLWIAAIKDNGYGVIGYGTKPRMAHSHRVSWMLEHGSVPDELMVLHRCDVRNCVNPEHLFLGTADDNLKDCSRKGRMHNGAQNGGAKLVEQEVRQIRSLLSQGHSKADLARKFKMSTTAIWKIEKRIKWKHVA